MFLKSNSKTTSDELLEIIEKNCDSSKKLLSKIERLKIKENKIEPIKIIDLNTEKDNQKPFLEESNFEDEALYYLSLYKEVRGEFLEEDLLEILPKRNIRYFKKIIRRLQMESLKEIKEINEIINSNKNDFTKQDLQEFKNDMLIEKRKFSILRDYFENKEKKENFKDKELNKIILVPNIMGNIRIINDIENISSSFYPRILDLINSIIDGTFKKVKKFNNNKNFDFFSEVRGYQVRVIFTRLNKNTYALVTAFIKKTDRDKYYTDYLTNLAEEYRIFEENLKMQILDLEFMRQNDLYVEQLIDKLSLQKANNKQYKKGGLND